MPKREDIKKILIIGSGPIIIGQAAEFDYSGSQACKALREEGYEVVLVNSNPATIMTDPEMADKTYIEPLNAQTLKKIIERERPQALLPTLGGQTALNLSMELGNLGVLDEYGVELIGASLEAIKKAEDRDLFKKAMADIGLEMPKSGVANDLEKAVEIASEIGYPLIVRPAFTLGGTGGGIARDESDFIETVKHGLSMSPIHQVLIEEGVIGWKEFEYEVIRDRADNVVIICSIENFDPMGVHTGDSITVAPAQTLTDRQYQRLRDASIAVIREIGVDTGGSNIQFALDPRSDRLVVIEMNPRVSRSSSLASKATGFPIAKIAAKLAVGYTLDELPNDITQKTPASFEPTIDYVVVKMPRFAFDKFPQADPVLFTQMKSVGEVMSIGRTFEEALQKSVRSLEQSRRSLCLDDDVKHLDEKDLDRAIVQPTSERIYHIMQALKRGYTPERIASQSMIDPWFIGRLAYLLEVERELTEKKAGLLEDGELLLCAKKAGYTNAQLANSSQMPEKDVAKALSKYGISVVYKMVDTCAGEFDAKTPYYYSTYEQEDDPLKSGGEAVIVLGSGPNRIGQGVEFDYCCVHAVKSLKEQGYDAIMVNNNPETVSTDYDTSDRLYFEPITAEDVLNICEREKARGVIVQFGGQTPLNIANSLSDLGVKILGTSHQSIELAEDRKRFGQLIKELGIPQPEGATAHSVEQALDAAKKIGYPLMVRPSFVLGGRGMAIVYDDVGLLEYAQAAAEVSKEHPMLIDRFMEDAVEVEVDAVCDGQDAYLPAIMEHIELAGIHSGDSACVIPTRSINEEHLETIRIYTKKLAKALDVVGLMNVQYVISDEKVYIIEANPRASRTVPYVSKVIGVPIAKLATRVIMGEKLADILGEKQYKMPAQTYAENKMTYYAVKEAVFSFGKFPGVDPVLGPEMKSTGEVMGIDRSFGAAYYKAMAACGMDLPMSGTVLLSIAEKDKKRMLGVAKSLKMMGYGIVATSGTKKYLEENGINCGLAIKIGQGAKNILTDIMEGRINMIVNTPTGFGRKTDSSYMRKTAIKNRIPYITTTAAAAAAVEGLNEMHKGGYEVLSIQEYHMKK